MGNIYYVNDRTIIVPKNSYIISFSIDNVNYEIHILNRETVWIFINGIYSMNITIDKRFIVVKDYELDIDKLYKYVKQCIRKYYDSYYLNEYVEFLFVLNKLKKCKKYKLEYQE